jgi:hypothetical protein
VMKAEREIDRIDVLERGSEKRQVREQPHGGDCVYRVRRGSG